MAFEPIPGNPEDFLPEDLVKENPEGADSIDFGDNHIRLIKLALKNLDRMTTEDLKKLKSYFDEKGRVKLALRAKEADRLSSDVDLSHFALKEGDYPELRAKGTTKGDVGLHRLLNMALSRGFDPATMSSNEYLSVHSLRAFHSQVLQDIDDKLVGDVDLTDYARIDGEYPGLRAVSTYQFDIGLDRFNGLATASKAWYEEYGSQSVSPYAVVTSAYIAAILNVNNFPKARPQTEYMFVDNWSGFSKEYNDEYPSETIRQVACDNTDRVLPLQYAYWLEGPKLKVEADNRTGKDIPFQIRLYNVIYWKGIIHADSTVSVETDIGFARILKADFNYSAKNYIRDLRLASNEKFTGRITVTYDTGVGVYTLWTARNIGAS